MCDTILEKTKGTYIHMDAYVFIHMFIYMYSHTYILTHKLTYSLLNTYKHIRGRNTRN